MNNTFRHLIKQRFANWQTVVFFALVLGLNACKGDQLLGLEVQPEGSLDPIQKVDTFSVMAHTVSAEPQVSEQFQNFIGSINNDVFGRSTASLYLNFVLESENVVLDLSPEEYIVDSLILTFTTAIAYGDVTEGQEIQIFVLDESIHPDSNYTSERTFLVDDNPVGSASIKFDSQTEFDALLPADKTQKLFLDLDLGEFLLQGLGTEYVTSDQFQEYFKGILIKNKDPQSIENGAIYNLALAGEGLGIVLYFHPINDDSEEAQQSLSYNVSNSTARFNHFDLDRSGSLVEDQIESFENGKDIIYVQGMSGVRSEIFFPGLNSFAKNTDVALSLARLKILTSSLQPNGLGYAPKLYLLDYEESPSTGDTLETLNLDYIFSSSRHGGNLEDDESGYIFDITRQVQKIIESAQAGENANLGFTLNAQVPVLNQNVYYQTVLEGSDNIVLELFYTDLNE